MNKVQIARSLFRDYRPNIPESSVNYPGIVDQGFWNNIFVTPESSMIYS